MQKSKRYSRIRSLKEKIKETGLELVPYKQLQIQHQKQNPCIKTESRRFIKAYRFPALTHYRSK